MNAVDRPPSAGSRPRHDLCPVHLPRLDETLSRLPRDVGLVLLSLGVAGLVIPGPLPPGVPFVIAGVVFVCPKVVKRFGGSVSRRFPILYAGFHNQVKRFQSDLEGRYPGSTRPR